MMKTKEKQISSLGWISFGVQLLAILAGLAIDSVGLILLGGFLLISTLIVEVKE